MNHNNANDDDLSSAEEIYVDFTLAQTLTLARFPNAKALLHLETLVPVKHVYPCDRCGAPVARVRLGRETRVVDCFRDEVRSGGFTPAWNADICSEHACMGRCQ
jgi:hypothetical protein